MLYGNVCSINSEYYTSNRTDNWGILHNNKIMKFQNSKNGLNFMCEKDTFSQIWSQI